MKKDIMILNDGKADMIKGGIVVFVPFIAVMLIPIWWLRMILTIGIIAFWAIELVRYYGDIVETVKSTECVNKRIFNDIPMDCKVRRSDDLDFPNSRK